MQFIRNGPDIPERLLQAHEDGRVVLLCGAGVSYPARLPGFKGLVERLFSNLSVTATALQQAAIKAQQFDTALGLLEADIAGGREKVRRAIAAILTPDLDAPSATATHEALTPVSGAIKLIVRVQVRRQRRLGDCRQSVRLPAVRQQLFDAADQVSTSSNSWAPPSQARLPPARWDGWTLTRRSFKM